MYGKFMHVKKFAVIIEKHYEIKETKFFLQI
jgi:hypothetical protein